MRRVGKALRNRRHNYVGRCNICGHKVPFICTDIRAARGNFFCPLCRSFSRKRHLAKFLLRELGGSRSVKEARPLAADIYSATSRDAIWAKLGSDPRYHGSEFLEGVALGDPIPKGGTCQNLESLTFDDDSFDIVLTEDVLEHVRYPDRAFAEIARVLRPGAVHLFTVPFNFHGKTIERVEPREGREDILLTEPEWHGDSVHGRALAYRTFGSDLFERLEKHGFKTRLRLAAGDDRRIGVVDSYVFESRCG
jgi:SAM-dependent methyltransferase